MLQSSLNAPNRRRNSESRTMTTSAPSANRNQASWDRAVRVLLGVAIFSLVFFGPKTAWGWLGLIPLLTGLVGFCPLYGVLNLSTCSMQNKA